MWHWVVLLFLTKYWELPSPVEVKDSTFWQTLCVAYQTAIFSSPLNTDKSACHFGLENVRLWLSQSFLQLEMGMWSNPIQWTRGEIYWGSLRKTFLPVVNWLWSQLSRLPGIQTFCSVALWFPYLEVESISSLLELGPSCDLTLVTEYRRSDGVPFWSLLSRNFERWDFQNIRVRSLVDSFPRKTAI